MKTNEREKRKYEPAETEILRCEGEDVLRTSNPDPYLEDGEWTEFDIE